MLDRKIKWSGVRESNTFSQLGRLEHNQCANPAQVNEALCDALRLASSYKAGS
jgi:hypothetical protein